jgi:hypothetical protein
MSAVTITLVDFADSFAAKTNSLDVPNIHPAGGATIWRWLCEMRAAAEANRSREVAELAQWVTDKVALQRTFVEEASCAHA